MANDESKRTNSDLKDPLAKDIARLYSWAQVDDAAYQDFTRQRRFHPKHEAQAPDGSSPQAASMPVAPPVEESPLQKAEDAIKASPDAVQNFPSPVPSAGNSAISLALYSVAGGVGKTTLCANLGRTLCSLGEKVMLVDASGRGLLPFFFGASDQRNGMRTFEDPDTNFPPLKVLGSDTVTHSWLEEQVKPAMRDAQRTIFDLGNAADALLPEIFSLCRLVVVVLLPDLNSTLTVSRIEASIQMMADEGSTAPKIFYIFNRFDGENPKHQQARAMVARQCGERLLPIAIPRSTDIAEALGEGMTMPDYAPDSDATHCFLELAKWLQKIAPFRDSPRLSPPRRWSER